MDSLYPGDLYYLAPANSSRFFSQQIDAVEQPVGKISLCLSDTESFVTNSLFDSTLICYDAYYCTDNPPLDLQALDHLRSILTASQFPKTVEIGCGRGAFVESLRNMGIDAVGFDPVAPVGVPYLVSDFWSIEAEGEVFEANKIDDREPIFYIMRCVLPHIKNPFIFLDHLFNARPNAKVYIEFQNLEYIFQNSLWYSISHDHVNYFSIFSFHNRYKVLTSGCYSSGEWSFVVLSKLKNSIEDNSDGLHRQWSSGIVSAFQRLQAVRDKTFQTFSKSTFNLTIYGAAGKGIVFAHAVMTNLPDPRLIIAVDTTEFKWFKFMECSGLEVVSPNFFNAYDDFLANNLIMVMNPNHVKHAKQSLSDRCKILTMVEILQPSSS